MTDQLKLNWLQSCQTHPNRFQSVGYFWSDKENLKIDFKGKLNFKFSFSDVTAVHLPRYRWRHHPRRGHHAGTFFYHLSKQSLERLYVLVLKYYSALGCGEDLFFLWMHGPSWIKDIGVVWRKILQVWLTLIPSTQRIRQRDSCNSVK